VPKSTAHGAFTQTKFYLTLEHVKGLGVLAAPVRWRDNDAGWRRTLEHCNPSGIGTGLDGHRWPAGTLRPSPGAKTTSSLASVMSTSAAIYSFVDYGVQTRVRSPEPRHVDRTRLGALAKLVVGNWRWLRLTRVMGKGGVARESSALRGGGTFRSARRRSR
jgi:hypothetical protein